jgi:hypothetical protein
MNFLAEIPPNQLHVHPQIVNFLVLHVAPVILALLSILRLSVFLKQVGERSVTFLKQSRISLQIFVHFDQLNHEISRFRMANIRI